MYHTLGKSRVRAVFFVKNNQVSKNGLNNYRLHRLIQCCRDKAGHCPATNASRATVRAGKSLPSYRTGNCSFGQVIAERSGRPLDRRMQRRQAEDGGKRLRIETTGRVVAGYCLEIPDNECAIASRQPLASVMPRCPLRQKRSQFNLFQLVQ